jgi:hypothetical protein
VAGVRGRAGRGRRGVGSARGVAWGEGEAARRARGGRPRRGRRGEAGARGSCRLAGNTYGAEARGARGAEVRRGGILGAELDGSACGMFDGGRMLTERGDLRTSGRKRWFRLVWKRGVWMGESVQPNASWTKPLRGRERASLHFLFGDHRVAALGVPWTWPPGQSGLSEAERLAALPLPPGLAVAWGRWPAEAPAPTHRRPMPAGRRRLDE